MSEAVVLQASGPNALGIVRSLGREGVAVTELRKQEGSEGFVAETTAGTIEARYVISATGAFQRPTMPPIVPQDSGLFQMHSTDYRNPGDLPAGNVLVVGAGSSGVQIATELMQSGRKTFLSVGSHHRPPRRYRGRDFCWWLGVLNTYSMAGCSRFTRVVWIKNW